LRSAAASLLHRHVLVPAQTIDAIDGTSRVIGLRVARATLLRF
jgi:hypothetical protein